MSLARKIGLDIQLPEGSLPSFYAQIIEEIAQNAPLFDRYKELLILEKDDLLLSALKVLEHYRVSSERCELLLLPPEGVEHEELYSDYVITAPSENSYIDLAISAVFTLHTAKPDAEIAPALLQLKEHLIGRLILDHYNDTLYIVNRQLSELAERIARAYGCVVKWRY